MSSEDSRIGNDYKVQLGNGDSPPVFADLCSAVDAGSVGEDKPLIDVTSYCDPARTYRNGLADGSEIPMQVLDIPGDLQVRALYTAYKEDELVDIRIVAKNAENSPDEYYQFRAVVRGWAIGLPIGERATKTFTLKVSGEVLWVY